MYRSQYHITRLHVGRGQRCLKLSDQHFLDINRVLSEFRDVFDGFIHTDPNIPPVIHPPVSLALQDKLELDRMESQEIICKVTEPTEWVSSLVAVEKPNGKLRVCLDPKDLIGLFIDTTTQ